jgi:hypothetical protein
VLLLLLLYLPAPCMIACVPYFFLSSTVAEDAKALLIFLGFLQTLLFHSQDDHILMPFGGHGFPPRLAVALCW